MAAGVLLVLAFATRPHCWERPRQYLFLTAAPLPGLAVAFSYDPDIQPALEQELATPYPALRLVLLRTIAVLAAGLPVIVALRLFCPAGSPTCGCFPRWVSWPRFWPCRPG